MKKCLARASRLHKESGRGRKRDGRDGVKVSVRQEERREEVRQSQGDRWAGRGEGGEEG